MVTQTETEAERRRRIRESLGLPDDSPVVPPLDRNAVREGLGLPPVGDAVETPSTDVPDSNQRRNAVRQNLGLSPAGDSTVGDLADDGDTEQSGLNRVLFGSGGARESLKDSFFGALPVGDPRKILEAAEAVASILDLADGHAGLQSPEYPFRVKRRKLELLRAVIAKYEANLKRGREAAEQWRLERQAEAEPTVGEVQRFRQKVYRDLKATSEAPSR